jgi:hypothetical protein
MGWLLSGGSGDLEASSTTWTMSTVPGGSSRELGRDFRTESPGAEYEPRSCGFLRRIVAHSEGNEFLAQTIKAEKHDTDRGRRTAVN